MSRIDEALAALAAAGDDGFGARRDVLERMSFDLLHRPALGGQIVAQLCAIETPSPNDEGLLDLLGAGLDAARIARENGKARGQTFLKTVEDALDLARRQGRMTPAHNLIFAQLWTRNGLQAPASLELHREDVTSENGRRAANPTEGEALLLLGRVPEAAACYRQAVQRLPPGHRGLVQSASAQVKRLRWALGPTAQPVIVALRTR